MPQNLVDKVITHYTKWLKCKAARIEAFIQEVTDKPKSELANEDYSVVLLEPQRLQRFVETSTR